jgi:hypothetical protein
MKTTQPLRVAILMLLATSVAPEVQAEARTFRNPALQGYRLDFCKGVGPECGERVATEWCVTQGYEYASDWGIDRDIGGLQPTIRVDNRDVCHGDQCDGFSEITCGREGRTFSMPSLGGDTRGIVFTPDQRHAAAAVTREEVQLVVPGCSQIEPGLLACQTEPDYQYCRTLLQDGYVLGCRAALAIDDVIGDLREADSSDYELTLRARASVTVKQGSRGEGRIRGKTEYSALFALSEYPDGAENCLRRDRYHYHQSGPNGGKSETFAAEDCDEPVEGSFEPNEDDLLHAYDLCEGRRAWGNRLEGTTDLIVAAKFHFAAATASSTRTDLNASRSAASYLAIGAPLQVVCND